MRRTLLTVFALVLGACLYPHADDLRQQPAGGIIPGAGTGGSDGTGGAGGSTAPDAAALPDGHPDAPSTRPCADYAASYCQRFRTCSSAQADILFGDRCVERIQLECELVELPEVTWPTRACVDSFAAQACDQMLRGSYAEACRSPGTLADGATCGSLFQCQSRRCAQLQGAACPSCVPRSQLGEPCSSALSCLDDLVCNDKKVCATPRAGGEPCDPSNPCLSPLLCQAGVCAAPGGVGAPCTGGDDCDSIHGVGCNPTVGKCVPFTVAGTCHTMSDGRFETCRALGTCSMGACVAAAADGQPCSDTLGPRCLPPATCKAGRCTLPSPVSCP
jgi:hypothetical protein